MRTNDKIHQLNLTEWAARFVEQKASGLTVKQWCEQNNYTIHTYNYWKHCLKEEVASQASGHCPFGRSRSYPHFPTR